jgi:hypothetical protein
MRAPAPTTTLAEDHRQIIGRQAMLLVCTLGRGRSILPTLRSTGYGRHVNRVADVRPHDHRRAAFSGGKFHDF